MINSIHTTANTFTEQQTQPTKKPKIFTVLLYRLLLLGVGSGLAGISGIVLATLYPNPHLDTPLLVKVLELVNTGNPLTLSNGSEAWARSTSANFDTHNEVETNPQAQLRNQLAQLQAQMKEIRDRTNALENQLGIPHSEQPLETRLQSLSNQLPAASTTSQGDTNQLATASAPADSANTFKVVLPSDLLFSENYTMLRTEAGAILDSVINDLRSYRGATIRIAVHTNNASQPEDNRNLSFLRGAAVQQYLSSILGDKYRWVVIGYGDTRPLVANDTEINQQRNRRLEISIDDRED